MGGSDLIRSESVKVVAFVKGKTNSPAELGLNSHVVTCPWTASGCRTLRAASTAESSPRPMASRTTGTSVIRHQANAFSRQPNGVWKRAALWLSLQMRMWTPASPFQPPEDPAETCWTPDLRTL